MANALFYLMGFGVIALSLGVILSKNPVMAVLSLLGSFFCLATIYLLAGFQFLAAAQILVYAGAIMVLFLFVIMLLNLGDDTRTKIIDTDIIRSRGIGVAGIVVGGVLAASLIALAGAKLPSFVTALNETGIGSPQALAERLFTDHALAFQGAGMLLLATTVAVLVLAKRERTGTESDEDEGAVTRIESQRSKQAMRSMQSQSGAQAEDRELVTTGGEKV